MPSIINATTTNGVAISPDNSGDLQFATNNGTTALTVSTGQQLQVHTAGSASAPVISKSDDTNTGIFFPAADTIAFSEGGVESMRIDSNGNLLIRATSNFAAANTGVGIKYTPAVNYGIAIGATSTSLGTAIIFLNSSNTQVGAITTDNTGTAYGTTSDYRLKENIAPMTGALEKVAQLKPVTYNWKIDGSAGQGFIAHELQEVCPDAVAGDKDAVDAQGNPVYQGVDTSFLVATLTAAIQELKAELDTVKAELQALKGTE